MATCRTSGPGRCLSPEEVVSQFNSLVRGVRHHQADAEEHEAIWLLDSVHWCLPERATELQDPERLRAFREEMGCLSPRSFTADGEVCGIELELQTAKTGLVLRCGHVFNKQAFKTYVQTTIIDGEVPVRCPMCRVDRCPLVLSWQETLDVLAIESDSPCRSAQTIDFHTKLLLKLAYRMAPRMGLRRCVSCPFFVPIVASERAHVRCPECSAEFCGLCSQAPHLPLPCTHARMYEDCLRSVERMTATALELLDDGTKGQIHLTAAQEGGLVELKTAVGRAQQAGLRREPGQLGARGDEEEELEQGEEEQKLPAREVRPQPGPHGEAASGEGRGSGKATSMEVEAETPPPPKDYVIREETKPCPSCSEPFEKLGGCPHITCSACRWEWCWTCLKPWRGHGSCSAMDLQTYDFSQELEWYSRHTGQAMPSAAPTQGPRGLLALAAAAMMQTPGAGAGVAAAARPGGAQELDVQALRERRREQLREVQEHYKGTVERENSRFAHLRHFRPAGLDSLSSFLGAFDAASMSLATRMQRARGGTPVDHDVLGFAMYEAGRRARSVDGLSPRVANLMERLALVLAGAGPEGPEGPMRVVLQSTGRRARQEQPRQPLPDLHRFNIDTGGMRRLCSLLEGYVEEVARDVVLLHSLGAVGPGPSTEPHTSRPEHFEILLKVAQALAAVSAFLRDNLEPLADMALERAVVEPPPPMLEWWDHMEPDFGAQMRMARMMAERERREMAFARREEHRERSVRMTLGSPARARLPPLPAVAAPSPVPSGTARFSLPTILSARAVAPEPFQPPQAPGPAAFPIFQQNESLWRLHAMEEAEEAQMIAAVEEAPVFVRHDPRLDRERDRDRARHRAMRVDTDHWRQRLRGIADMVENAQGVVDLETAQRFEALFGLRVPAQATLVRVTAAIREGERRRMLAIHGILQNLRVALEAKKSKQQLLLEHFSTARAGQDDGLFYFRAYEFLVRLGLMALPSEQDDLAGRLAYIQLVLVSNSGMRAPTRPGAPSHQPDLREHLLTLSQSLEG